MLLRWQCTPFPKFQVPPHAHRTPGTRGELLNACLFRCSRLSYQSISSPHHPTNLGGLIDGNCIHSSSLTFQSTDPTTCQTLNPLPPQRPRPPSLRLELSSRPQQQISPNGSERYSRSSISVRRAMTKLSMRLPQLLIQIRRC